MSVQDSEDVEAMEPCIILPSSSMFGLACVVGVDVDVDVDVIERRKGV